MSDENTMRMSNGPNKGPIELLKLGYKRVKQRLNNE